VGKNNQSRVKQYIHAMPIQINAVAIQIVLFEGDFAGIDIVEINSNTLFWLRVNKN
jgi:hypothetical protein